MKGKRRDSGVVIDGGLVYRSNAYIVVMDE